MKNSLVIALIFTLFSLSFAPLAPADAMVREWDSHFDQGGIAIYDAAANTDYFPKDIAVQEDGKIVEVLTVSSVGSSYLVVLRYNTDGTLDDDFGTGGVFTYSESANDFGYGVAVDDDGSILVTGETTGPLSDYDMLLLKLNPIGELDTAFGDEGVYIRDIAGETDLGSRVAIQSNGKIVVGGSSSDSGHISMTVYRVNADGTTDTDFGSDIGPADVFINDAGFATRGLSCSDMFIDMYGNIVVNGQARSIMPNAVTSILWRITPGGELDSTFNPLGEGFGAPGYVLENGRFSGGITELSDGSLITSNRAGTTTYVSKYDSTGGVDGIFGTGGSVSFSNESAVDVYTTYNDGILVLTSTSDYTTAVLRRLDSTSGDIDTVFADGDSTTYSIVTYSEITCSSLNEYRSTGNVYFSCQGYDDAEGNYDSLMLDFESSYQISGLPANLKPYNQGGHDLSLGSLYGLVGEDSLMVRTVPDDYPLAIVPANFDHDLDWSDVSGDVDWTNRKSVTAGLEPEDEIFFPTGYLEGITGNELFADGSLYGYFLFVPKAADDDTLRICPDATTLTAVTGTCANGVELHEGDSGVFVGPWNGHLYWMYTIQQGFSQTGTGGMSFNSALPETGQALGLPFVLGAILCAVAARKKYLEM